MSSPIHRGRIQVQGEDLKEELSWSWAQDTPPTAQEALEELKKLKQQLSPAALNLRDRAFQEAKNWIEQAAKNGGVAAPVNRTFPKYRKSKGNERVDIEILTGEALI